MPDIRHHLTDELLMAYSAGTLPEAFGLVIATHVSMCDDCRALLEGYDAVGGHLLDAETALLDDSSLARTMALISQMTATSDAAPATPPPTDGVFPTPLQAYVGGDLQDVKWSAAGAGVKQSILTTDDDATARLLYIPAGQAVPDHGHQGTELTLVLRGAFSDQFDTFARGDVEVANEDLQHTPIASPGEPCICLAATDAPLLFSGFVPRLAQRFLKI